MELEDFQSEDFEKGREKMKNTILLRSVITRMPLASCYASRWGGATSPGI
jgi:hypothetical protein